MFLRTLYFFRYKYAESTGLTVESSFPLDTVDGRAHSCHAFDPVIKNTESHYMSLNGNEQLLKDIIKQGKRDVVWVCGCGCVIVGVCLGMDLYV